MTAVSAPQEETRKAPRWSLVMRLTATLGVGLCLLWLAATAFAVIVMTHEINEVFDSGLQETAQRLRPLVAAHLQEHAEKDEAGLAEEKAAPHEEYLQYQVRDKAGNVILRSHDAPVAGFPAPLQQGFAEIAGQRFYTEAAADQGFFIQVGEARDHRADATRDSLIWLILPLLALLPLSGILILRAVRRATAPIDALSLEMGRRGGGNLEPVPEAGLPRELMPVAHGLNHLLLRLRMALEHERAFAANSAHELRTPVAAALAQLQRLAAETPEPQQRQRVQQATQSIRRIGELAEKLLQLSRAESGISLADDPADLLPVLRLVISDYLMKPDLQSRLEIDYSGVTELVAAIDIDAFAIVLRNLIDNALLHGAGSGPVRISVGPDRRLSIRNSGTVIPPAILAELRQRFARGQTAAAGSGLGLAIVDTILQQAGYALVLKSPATGETEGFEAIIDLNKSVADHAGM